MVWSSSDESIAKVDQEGNVTPIKNGFAEITVKIDGTEIKDTCNVFVGGV